MKNVTGKNGAGNDFQRIAFITVYFGKVPWYFNFFNKSCAYNPDVDFILITDMNVTEGLADNITIVKSSLADISKRCTQKLGFEINILRPYKLCDYRPAYGVIFSDLIEGYDFWGYCDMDLVFGNIRSLITADILKGYDVITIKKDYIAGFFTLFRNNKTINNLFKKSKDYRKVFQDAIDYCFDECNWEWNDLMRGKDISEVNSEIESITHVIKAAERSGDIIVFWHTMEYHPGKIVWDRGELFYNKNERALLCHFIFFKALEFNYVPKWKNIPERFYMHSYYFSRHAPGSLADRLLRLFLTTARLIKAVSNIGNQYTQWIVSYLFASRKIHSRDLQHSAGLVGNYKLRKMVVRVFVKGDRLHVSIGNIQSPLLYKGAGKFVLEKCKFYQLVNLKFDFQFDANIKANILQVTGSGIAKFTFLKVS